MDQDDRRGRVQSVEQAARVLAALAALGRASLAAVGREAAMPPAKAHRYLKSLVLTGLAEQDAATGRYAPGPAALALGLAALGQVDAARAAAPVLARLCEATGATCLLALPPAHAPVVVAMEVPPGAVAVQSRLGAVLPAHSASGRALAGEAPALLRGAVLPGVDALAAPIRDHGGRIVAALTAMGPSGALEGVLAAVQAAAAEASRGLGYARSSTET